MAFISRPNNVPGWNDVIIRPSSPVLNEVLTYDGSNISLWVKISSTTGAEQGSISLPITLPVVE